MNVPPVDEVMQCAEQLCDCAIAYVTAKNVWAQNNAVHTAFATKAKLRGLIEALQAAAKATP
jgi:predicted CoA-binding protein